MGNINNFVNFLKESEGDKYDSFIINVKYEVGSCDIDPKSILTSALQKKYKGWGNVVILDNIELKLIDSKYDSETYEVIYNKDKDEYDKIDNEIDVYNLVDKIIRGVTYYTYRSGYTMDTRQKTDIKVISVEKLK